MIREFTGKIGFCIGPEIARPNDPAIFETLKSFGTPPLSDGLNKFNTMDPGIKPVASGVRAAGPALTVRLRPGDNLMLHKAIGLARAGDVIVVDTCGSNNNSIMGDLMSSAAFSKGVAAVIIDGGIRDVKELQEKGYPVFARYITPSVGDKEGPGEIGLPISCGGVPVMPGDYIVADDNGVVVLPPEWVDKIVEGTRKKLAYEEVRAKEIEAGVYMKPAIDEQLKKAGVIE
ncbi:Regulator of ribonuclease activity A [bioreactor metagenome]|uniref:Regulator of ribonuclease activity A n=1 Tax=bioreactor metagenome TaxID=1076179 RepID=A0A645BVJ6_9ZZZZ